jgi:hypothetical protein
MSKRKAQPKEHATVLFALRYLQSNYEDSGIRESPHFDGENYMPCTPNEIDDLCDGINHGTITL